MRQLFIDFSNLTGKSALKNNKILFREKIPKSNYDSEQILFSMYELISLPGNIEFCMERSI